MNIPAINNTVEIGLIYSLIALGVYLSFKIINFSDLTVDGSFTLGAAVAVNLLLKDVNLPFCLISSFCAGAAAGFISSILNVKYKIMNILASILTMSALYSVNLRIMGAGHVNIDKQDDLALIIFAVIISIAILLILFLKSEIGLAIRITGQNPEFASSNGVNVGKVTIITLMLSNGMIALAGAFFCLMQGFVDITMGAGTLIIGLASIIIGEQLIKKRTIPAIIFIIMLGAVLYRLLINFALNLETASFTLIPTDLNLLTSSLIVILMVAKKIRG